MDKDYWKTKRVAYSPRRQKSGALLNKRRLLIILAAIFIALCYWGLYKILHLPYFQITNIEISGSNAFEQSSLREFLQNEITGDRWHLIPRSNILFFSTRGEEKRLEDFFPSLEAVSLHKIFPHGLKAVFSSRVLWAVYCKTDKTPNSGGSPDVSQGQCFYIDRGGTVFREAPKIEGNLILTFKSDYIDPVLGEKIFSQELLGKLETTIQIFKEKTGLVISNVELKENAPKDMWAKTNEGFVLILQRDDDPHRSAEIVKMVLDNEIKDKRTQLEYIDARFGNKVFYKYRTNF